MCGVNEEIYGKLATAYHRTNAGGMKALMRGQIYKDPRSTMYGPGVYMTYDLESQLNPRMVSIYGNYLIKNRVNLENFLIFDKNIIQRVYGVRDFSEQMRRIFKTPPEMWNSVFDPSFAAILRQHMVENYPQYTSEVARKMVQFHITWLRRNTRGIVFTGKQDGRVIVAFDPKSVTPMSYVLNKENSKTFNWKLVKEWARETFNPPLIPGASFQSPHRELAKLAAQFKQRIEGRDFRIIDGTMGLNETHRGTTELPLRISFEAGDYREPFLKNRIGSAIRQTFPEFKHREAGDFIQRQGGEKFGPWQFRFVTILEGPGGLLKDAPRSPNGGPKWIQVKIR
jgi:hypothetical protein